MTTSNESDLYLPRRIFIRARKVEPGTGQDVADWLATNGQRVLQSSNRPDDVSFVPKGEDDTRSVGIGSWIALTVGGDLIGIFDDENFHNQYRSPDPDELGDQILGGPSKK